jgi:hypothetical protein
MLHRWVTYWLVLFSSLLFSFNAQSQETGFRVIHFDETTGLQTSIINAILQDKTAIYGLAPGRDCTGTMAILSRHLKRSLVKATAYRITLF